MKIDYVYAAVFVSDMDASEAFYSKVFGRVPDDRPIPTLIQWRSVGGNARIQLFHDPGKSGNSQMTLVVSDLEGTQDALGQAGIGASETVTGNFGKISSIKDPDGNVVVLAEPPRS